MSASSLGPFIERLQALFLDSYDKQSLRELLLFKMNQNLANEVAEGDNFRAVVFNLLVKALMEGWLLKLAQEARERRQELKPEWVIVVQELEVALTRVVVQPSPGLVAIPRGKAPPEDLQAVIRRYDQLASTARYDAPVTAPFDDLARHISTFPLED
jgi:Effector-associated domain 1